MSRRLLRGCIALTRHLRSEEGSAEVSVDIDTLTFDRPAASAPSQALPFPTGQASARTCNLPSRPLCIRGDALLTKQPANRRLGHYLYGCRVLIFLEAEALGREPPAFGLHLIAALQDAADKLGLRSLQAGCC